MLLDKKELDENELDKSELRRKCTWQNVTEPVEGTQYASANFNLYLITYLAFMVNLVNKKWKTENFYPTPAFQKQWEHLVQKK